MISLQTSAASVGATPPSAAMTALRTLREAAAKPKLVLPTAAETRQSLQAQEKAMASRKLEAIRERMKALKLITKIDPKSALKLAGDLAKELKAAVKAYVAAGGRNVSQGEMAMIRRDATEARDAASTASDAVPAQPDAVEGEVSAPVNAEIKRAQQAYGMAVDTAETRDASARRLEAVEGEAMADEGFFRQVKQAVADLRKARQDIKAAALSSPNPPSDDDWKAADKEQAELERTLDMAPTGAPEPTSSAPVSISA